VELSAVFRHRRLHLSSRDAPRHPAAIDPALELNDFHLRRHH
jgi:hypothetical protein